MTVVTEPAPRPSGEWQAEIAKGDRFEFGANWQRFLAKLDDRRIDAAVASLAAMLGRSDLQDLTFLDAGSGSGLFSLAARKLGASVRSFDFDPNSVSCTQELRRRYFPDDANWTVEQASVLDESYLARLSQFDIVYSWGVLHHTGQMWDALGNVAPRVRDGGQLFVAIYNDQGSASARWATIKRAYVRSPKPLKLAVLGAATVRLWAPTMAKDLLRGRPLRSWRDYERSGVRGMDPWRDVVDWVGGYPFEVAKPEQILDFYTARGFTLTRMATCGGGLGCNEFVFGKD